MGLFTLLGTKKKRNIVIEQWDASLQLLSMSQGPVIYFPDVPT